MNETVAAVMYPVALRPHSAWDRLGPVPFVEQAVNGGDEQTDRGRIFPPHIRGLLFDGRSHISALELKAPSVNISNAWRRHGLDLQWIEALRFIENDDAEALEAIPGGNYPEVFTGLAILHFSLSTPGASALLQEFTSRYCQDRHDEVRKLVAPIGSLRRETSDRLMDPSELPLVMVTSVQDDGKSAEVDAESTLGRTSSGAIERLSVSGWNWSLWSDAVTISASRLDGHPYRFLNRTPWVADSVMIDAVAFRFAQYHALAMLARRTADGAAESDHDARALHRVALRIRSRVWWPRLSPEPFIEVPARALSRIWGLEGLAEVIFADASGLAQQADLVATERLNRILFVLTAGALLVASVSLTVQVTTSSRPGLASLAAVAAALAASAAIVLSRSRRVRASRFSNKIGSTR